MTLFRFFASLVLFIFLFAASSFGYTVTYTVQPGETLENLSQTFGINKARIMYANDLKNETDLRAGQTIIIPNSSFIAGDTSASDPIGSYAASRTVKFSPTFDNISQNLSASRHRPKKGGKLAFDSPHRKEEAGLKASMITPSGARVTGIIGYGSDAFSHKTRAWESSTSNSGPVGGFGLQIPF